MKGSHLFIIETHSWFKSNLIVTLLLLFYCYLKTVVVKNLAISFSLNKVDLARKNLDKKTNSVSRDYLMDVAITIS